MSSFMQVLAALESPFFFFFNILYFLSISQLFFLYPFCPSKIQFNHSKLVFLLRHNFFMSIFLVPRNNAAHFIPQSYP